MKTAITVIVYYQPQVFHTSYMFQNDARHSVQCVSFSKFVLSQVLQKLEMGQPNKVAQINAMHMPHS